MDTKHPKSPSSAEAIAENDDLLTETILVRLPPKLLVKFQSVSKHWQSLITAASFARLHSLRHHNKPQFSFLLRMAPAGFFHLDPTRKILCPFPFKSPHVKILQSCNGLLLLESRNSPYAKRHFAVFNPTTRQSKIVKMRMDMHITGVSLAFDPSVSDHYKFVCIHQPQHSVKVFDSGTRRWTSLGQPFPSDIITLLHNGVYMNNQIFWIRPTSRSFCLDLETGEVKNVPEIPSPVRKNGKFHRNYVLESNGLVHCVTIIARYDMKRLFVFELSGDGSAWFERWEVDLQPMAIAFPEMVRVEVGVIGIARGVVEEESMILIHVPRKVICYNFWHKSFEVVLDFTSWGGYDESRLQFQRFDCHQFLQTMARI